MLFENLLSRLRPAHSATAPHISQNASFLRIRFNPQRLDFETWVATPPEELWAQPELADLRAALLTRQPLAFLRHQRLHRAA